MPSAGPTVKSLDERVDDLERAVHSEIADLRVAMEEQARHFDQKIHTLEAGVGEKIATLKTSLEMSLGVTKWVTTLAAGIILTLLGLGWQYSAASGELKQRVTGLEQRTEKLEQRIERIEQKMDEMRQLLLTRLPKEEEKE